MATRCSECHLHVDGCRLIIATELRSPRAHSQLSSSFYPRSEHSLHTCPRCCPVLPPAPVQPCGWAETRGGLRSLWTECGAGGLRAGSSTHTPQPHARGISPKWVTYSPQDLIEGKLAADWKGRFWLPTQVTLNEGDEFDVCQQSIVSLARGGAQGGRTNHSGSNFLDRTWR